MVALWGVRDFAHRRALSILDSRTYSGEIPQRFSALPDGMNPFTWTGVVETETSFHVVSVNALDADKPAGGNGDIRKAATVTGARGGHEDAGRQRSFWILRASPGRKWTKTTRAIR